MKLENEQIVTLDNNKEYIVIKQVELDGKTYAYLITTTKPIEILIVNVQYINEEIILTIVDSKDELEKIINLFEN